MDRTYWRAIIKAPTPDTRGPPVDYTGARIDYNHGQASHAGTILGVLLRDNVPNWVALLDNGTAQYFDSRTVSRLIIPLDDPIEFNRAAFLQPRHLLGYLVQKSFSGIAHRGVLATYDIDQNGYGIWEARYQDGDAEGYYSHEILPLLENYARPPPLVGRFITKIFPDGARYRGCINGFDQDSATLQNIWRVRYEDGDLEDLNLRELLDIRIL